MFQSLDEFLNCGARRISQATPRVRVLCNSIRCAVVVMTIFVLIERATTSALLASEPATARWSGFQNGGHCAISGDLPTEWSQQSDTLLWRVKLEGYGQSSPVIAHSRVFVTSTSGDNKQHYHMAAFDLSNGTRLWQTDFANPSPEEKSGYVSLAAPSPVVDERGVFTLFEGGVLAALEFDGTIRWKRDLVADYGPIKSRHGLASSLEQNATHIFVWIERAEEPYLMAVERETGQTAWKVPGLGSTSWSSPRLIAVGQTEQLVCSSSGKLAGFDPQTGKRLWERNDLANNTTCTPMPTDSGQFILGASDGRGEQSAAGNESSNGLVQIVAHSDGTYSADFVWRAERATCSFGSPLVVKDRVWMVNRAGVLYQLDLKTGAELAASRIKSGSIWATPLQVEDRVYLFGQKGTTTILSASDGRELATNALWSEGEKGATEAAAGTGVQYAAAAARGVLVLRCGDTLYALKNP